MYFFLFFLLLYFNPLQTSIVLLSSQFGKYRIQISSISFFSMSLLPFLHTLSLFPLYTGVSLLQLPLQFCWFIVSLSPWGQTMRLPFRRCRVYFFLWCECEVSFRFVLRWWVEMALHSFYLFIFFGLIGGDVTCWPFVKHFVIDLPLVRSNSFHWKRCTFVPCN